MPWLETAPLAGGAVWRIVAEHLCQARQHLMSSPHDCRSVHEPPAHLSRAPLHPRPAVRKRAVRISACTEASRARSTPSGARTTPNSRTSTCAARRRPHTTRARRVRIRNNSLFFNIVLLAKLNERDSIVRGEPVQWCYPWCRFTRLPISPVLMPAANQVFTRGTASSSERRTMWTDVASSADRAVISGTRTTCAPAAAAAAAPCSLSSNAMHWLGATPSLDAASK